MQFLKKEELEKLSPQSLPIKAGDGRTPDTAYILQEINQLEAPSLEHLIIDLNVKASDYLFWELNTQKLTKENDRKIDCLEVKAVKQGGAREYSFYFDISDLKI